MKKYRIFSHFADASCGYYRSVLPTVHLSAGLLESGIDLRSSNRFDDGIHHDAYIFGRIPDQYTFMAALKAYERGAKIVWDIDDDFPSIPEWSPAKEHFGPIAINYLEECFKMSSVITCSTRRLADATIGRWPTLGGKVVVLENLIDAQTYSLARPPIRRYNEVTRILWTGTNTHIGDLGPVRAIMEYVQFTPGYVLVIYGHMPDDFRGRKNVLHVPHTLRRDYEGILSMIGADVALLPLDECPFNRCKSSIKFYETAMAGALCIGSDTPPFSDVIQDHITGRLINNNHADEWIDAVSSRDPESIEDMKKNARREVAESFSWNSDNPRRRAWDQFFRSLPGQP